MLTQKKWIASLTFQISWSQFWTSRHLVEFWKRHRLISGRLTGEVCCGCWTKNHCTPTAVTRLFYKDCFNIMGEKVRPLLIAAGRESAKSIPFDLFNNSDWFNNFIFLRPSIAHKENQWSRSFYHSTPTRHQPGYLQRKWTAKSLERKFFDSICQQLPAGIY